MCTGIQLVWGLSLCLNGLWCLWQTLGSRHVVLHMQIPTIGVVLLIEESVVIYLSFPLCH